MTQIREHENRTSWVDRPRLSGTVWFVLGAIVLSILSVFQKKALGADPFALEGYIVPILFGGGSASIIGYFFRQSRRQILKRLHAEMDDAQHARDFAQDQEILAHIINLALTQSSLNDILQGALEKLLTRRGLNLDPKGSIFLFDSLNQKLGMVAQVGLPDVLLSSCAEVAAGQCLCGRVASERRVVFADCIDHRHETTYDGIKQHGHYCAPIEDEDCLLGVLNLYVPHGHVRSGKEDLFVTAITGALATTIRRVQAERKLLRAKDSLEDRVRERTRELRKLSTALDQISAMVFITDRNGVIEYINPMFTKMTGYETHEAIGKTPRILKSGATPKSLYENLWQTILAGDIWRGEIKDRHKTGRLFWVSASVSPIKDDTDTITHFVAMHEDISARKEAEAAIISARESAETANRAKAELLANTSHELRTPLNAIIGFSSALKEELFGPLANVKQVEYVDDIHSSGTHLLDLINDILDVSAIEAGKMELHETPCNLNHIIDACIKMVAPRAQSGHVRLNFDDTTGLPALFADERRIKQVVLNLLSNAIKFTPENGQVSLGLGLDDHGRMRLSVEDTGIGMNDDELKKAMMQFGQVDSGHTRKHQGTGLGLPLTKGLVELHGGVMNVHSATDQGTQVTITFPKERVVLEAY